MPFYSKKNLKTMALNIFFFLPLYYSEVNGGGGGVPSVIAPLTHSDSQSKKVGEASL